MSLAMDDHPRHHIARRGRQRRRATVAIALSNPDLRNLVRADLEAQGFDIASVTAGPHEANSADVMVTEFDTAGAPLTVRVVEDLGEAETEGAEPSRSRTRAPSDHHRTVRLPSVELHRLGEVIAGELK